MALLSRGAVSRTGTLGLVKCFLCVNHGPLGVACGPLVVRGRLFEKQWCRRCPPLMLPNAGSRIKYTVTHQISTETSGPSSVCWLSFLVCWSCIGGRKAPISSRLNSICAAQSGRRFPSSCHKRGILETQDLDRSLIQANRVGSSRKGLGTTSLPVFAGESCSLIL